MWLLGWISELTSLPEKNTEIFRHRLTAEELIEKLKATSDV